MQVSKTARDNFEEVLSHNGLLLCRNSSPVVRARFCHLMAGVGRHKVMAKGVVAVDAMNRRFRGCIAPGRWTLCLGAGISRGLAPTWFDLALDVPNATFGATYEQLEFQKMVAESGWSLDAWIQAAANEFVATGRSLHDFNDLLESVLYGPIRKAAIGLAIEKHLIRVLNNPITAEKNRVIEVCDFFESVYKDSSLLGVVRFLINAARANRNPYAIITFNADTFLETLIYLFLRRDHYNGPGRHGHPPYYYKSVHRPTLIANRQIHEKTNIFHCHGTVMPRQTSDRTPRDSRDRLVFLEQEYLRIAGTTASWPETLFLFHAQTTRMIFAGLSMSDANIRRWMSASELEIGQDYTSVATGRRVNPEHLWLTRKPKDTASSRLKLVAMLHMGVRPAWLSDWSQLETALSNMLAL